MGTPELTPESLVTLAIWAALCVVMLLLTWLVVRSAVRSELRGDRSRAPVGPRVTSPRNTTSDDVEASTVTLETAGGAPRSAPPAESVPAPVFTGVPPANPYARAATPFPISLAQLPPPFTDEPVFIDGSENVMSANALAAAAPAPSSLTYASAPPPHGTPVVNPAASGGASVAALHALEQLTHPAPGFTPQPGDAEPPPRRGRHS